ncbi:MAG TPA: MerR family transcriptional regulator, partial [Acidimicrobiales bacterium]|nr:MerR family transcriptional regulator [Acidimicrobiales bacterium]
MPERAYLSIGEVLALLKDEFTDITISKIRFLESQGLIDPERTPSGYRKFYDPDVERLRWILRQQKEHYLPLRVIKGKLSDVQAGDVQAGDVQAGDVPAGDVPAGQAPAGDDVEDEEGEDVKPSTPPALAAVPDPPEEEAAALEDEPEAEAPVAGELVVVGTAPEPALEAPETPREPAAPPV